ncbi:MAG: hypothetical protein ABIE43_02655 [Patescibacteria group bacterium]
MGRAWQDCIEGKKTAEETAAEIPDDGRKTVKEILLRFDVFMQEMEQDVI